MLYQSDSKLRFSLLMLIKKFKACSSSKFLWLLRKIVGIRNDLQSEKLSVTHSFFFALQVVIRFDLKKKLTFWKFIFLLLFLLNLKDWKICRKLNRMSLKFWLTNLNFELSNIAIQNIEFFPLIFSLNLSISRSNTLNIFKSISLRISNSDLLIRRKR
jgi:hypothetical protein